MVHRRKTEGEAICRAGERPGGRPTSLHLDPRLVGFRTEKHIFVF
jgi:hypothetical protein